MKIANVVTACLLAVLVALAVWRGHGAFQKGMTVGGKTLLSTLPILVMSFAIAGLVQALVPKELVVKWLGAGTGFRGIIVGSVAGALTPGAPYFSFPIVAALYKQGASVGAVVAFVAGWSVWQLTRLPLEAGLVGPKLALARFVSTLVVPPLAGLFAQAVFGRWA